MDMNELEGGSWRTGLMMIMMVVEVDADFDQQLKSWSIILCVLFGACKSEGELNVTFKVLVCQHKAAYNTQDSDRLYWNVLLDENKVSSKHVFPQFFRHLTAASQLGNIIEFYNQKIVPTCKVIKWMCGDKLCLTPDRNSFNLTYTISRAQ
eukprot:761556-Hanusia_phi.AAC.1